MPRRSKPYTLRLSAGASLSPRQVENIDEMFDILFEDTFNGRLTIDAAQIVSGTLAVVRGGTGLNTYAVGDLLYASGQQTLSRLADVAVGSALISGGVGSAPAWGKVGLTTHVTGILPIANGGTGTNIAFALGSLVIAGASGIYTEKALSGNASQFLDGTGNWDVVRDSDLSLSDILTNNVSTAAHGFIPKAPNNVNQYFRGDGAWATISDVPENYNPGTAFTLPTDGFRLQYQHLYLTSTERMTLQGTAEVYISDFAARTPVPLTLGSPKYSTVSFIVPDGYFYSVQPRLALNKDNRATLVGSADLILSDDFGTRSRIVLS